MGNTVYRAVSGSLAELRRLDVLSNNLAHADTAGFKADRLRFSEVLDQRNQSTGFVDLPSATIDNTAGSLRVTDNPLDVAITGEGWLVVDAGGQQQLTRMGSLRRGASGNLETQSGEAVLARGGSPLALPDLPGEPITISNTGEVRVGDKAVGSLMFAKAAPNTLTKAGLGLFQPSGPVTHDPSVTVQQGVIEESNVNPVASMTELISVQRHFDALQQAIRSYRELDEYSNRRLR